MTLVDRTLVALLFTFTASDLMASLQSEKSNHTYLVSLTYWTLLLTCLAVLPVPAAVRAAALAVNVIVCGLYYSIINPGQISGRSVIAHGGAAGVLLILTAKHGLACSPVMAAVVTAGFLVTNACAQLWYERTYNQHVYPTSSYEHPLWRLLAVPALGTAIAVALTIA